MWEALEKAKHDTDVAVRPHQVKKLSVSMGGKYWSKAKDLSLEGFTGNKSYATLERYYLKKTPRLKLSCSLPLGTAPRRLISCLFCLLYMSLTNCYCLCISYVVHFLCYMFCLIIK